MARVNVQVTVHAVQRWRERMSTHGDEDGRPIITAFHESRRLASDDPLLLNPGLMRRDHSAIRWHYHDARRLFLVVQTIDVNLVRIVTVFTNPINGYRNSSPAERLETTLADVPPGTEIRVGQVRHRREQDDPPGHVFCLCLSGKRKGLLFRFVDATVVTIAPVSLTATI